MNIKNLGQGKPYNCTQSNTIAQSKLIWFLFCIKISSHLEFYNRAQIAWFLVHDDNPQQTNIYLWYKIRGSLLLRSVLLLLLYYYLPACSRRNFVKDTGRRRSVATTNAMSFFLLSGLSVKILFILLLGIFLIASTRREDERFYHLINGRSKTIGFQSDEFWWNRMGTDEYWWVLMCFDVFWWILMGSDGFWWVLISFDVLLPSFWTFLQNLVHFTSWYIFDCELSTWRWTILCSGKW